MRNERSVTCHITLYKDAFHLTLKKLLLCDAKKSRNVSNSVTIYRLWSFSIIDLQCFCVVRSVGPTVLVHKHR